MTIEDFTRFIEIETERQEKIDKLYHMDIDMIQFFEPFYEREKILLKYIYDEEGINWIEWYLFERPRLPEGEHHAWDENENPICYDIPSLYSFVEESHKIKN